MVPHKACLRKPRQPLCGQGGKKCKHRQNRPTLLNLQLHTGFEDARNSVTTLQHWDWAAGESWPSHQGVNLSSAVCALGSEIIKHTCVETNQRLKWSQRFPYVDSPYGQKYVAVGEGGTAREGSLQDTARSKKLRGKRRVLGVGRTLCQLHVCLCLDIMYLYLWIYLLSIFLCIYQRSLLFN